MSKRQAEIEKRRENLKKQKIGIDALCQQVEVFSNLARFYKKEKHDASEKLELLKKSFEKNGRELEDYIVETEMFDEGTLLAQPVEIIEKIVGCLDIADRARLAMCNKRLQKWFKPNPNDTVPFIVERHRRLMHTQDACPAGFTTVFSDKYTLLKPQKGYEQYRIPVWALGRLFFVKFGAYQEVPSVDFKNNLIVCRRGIAFGSDDTLIIYSGCYNNHSNYDLYNHNGKYGMKRIGHPNNHSYYHYYDKQKTVAVRKTTDRSQIYLHKKPTSGKVAVTFYVKEDEQKIGFLTFKDGLQQIVNSNSKDLCYHIDQHGNAVLTVRESGMQQLYFFKKTSESGDEYKFVFKQALQFNRRIRVVDLNEDGINIVADGKNKIWLALR